MFYPSEEYIKVTFINVFNFEKVPGLFTELENDALERDWNGSRIDKVLMK